MNGLYATGTAKEGVEAALVAAGKDLTNLQPAELAMLEDFHTGGRFATVQLADLAGITSSSQVLDAGAGIGGTARYVADRFGCAVTAVDLSGEYCEIARRLDQLVGLDHRIAVHQGDVTALPFADASYDVVLSQHVQMNVEDKKALYAEARRVLHPGGRLAIWDLTAGRGHLDYPLPWADGPEYSQLSTSNELKSTIEAAGFTIDHWSDLTSTVGPLMQTIQSLPPSPLGLHSFVPNFEPRLHNLTQALTTTALHAIQAVARAC